MKFKYLVFASALLATLPTFAMDYDTDIYVDNTSTSSTSTYKPATKTSNYPKFEGHILAEYYIDSLVDKNDIVNPHDDRNNYYLNLEALLKLKFTQGFFVETKWQLSPVNDRVYTGDIYADHPGYIVGNSLNSDLYGNYDYVKRKFQFSSYGLAVETLNIGYKNDNFADNVFQTVFTQFRLKYNLMLITQDRNLASDILAIGKSKAVNTENRILVERINKYGYLSLANVSEVRSPAEKHSHSGYTPNQQMEIPAYECFSIAASVRKVSGNMSVSSIPGEGSTLTAERNGNRKLLRLVSAGPSGGEGTIYTTAKIYKPEKLNRAKCEKLSLMMTKSINCEGVCFPLALLYNDKNEFVGYLMNKAGGKELQRCVFIPQLLKKNFPGWTKVDTTTLCVTILRKLKYLHERNVILGDINPNNILVVSPSQVYFVDKDPGSGASALYSLADFKIRNDMDVQKAYLLGKFGPSRSSMGVT